VAWREACLVEQHTINNKLVVLEESVFFFLDVRRAALQF
jgi:hypothetical protein